MAGDIIHLQASLIKAQTFFDIGGFNNMLVGGGGEDNDMLRRITLVGDIVGSDKLVVCKVMGEAGSTTDFSTLWNSLGGHASLS